MTRAGETHMVSRRKAISDKLVNYCIAWCLEVMLLKSHEAKISSPLIVLIKYQLGVAGSEEEFEYSLAANRQKAIHAAASLISKDEAHTYRRIGDMLGVNASTVLRWFPDGDLIEEAGKFIELLSKYGLSTDKGN